jgi:DNA-binding NarL/FixJ family response regulator
MGLKVLIVDDHALVRSGFASLLVAHDIEVVGEASSGPEAVEQTRLLRPDIVLMDLKMPGGDGLYATRLIRAEMPDTRIVMLTAFDDDDGLLEALTNGAAGYVLKNVKAEDFIPLLSRVMDGEVVVSPWIASRIVKQLRNSGERAQKKRKYDALTSREIEVLTLVAGGATNKEIATSLVVSDNTVKYHLRNIMEKLELKNRAQLGVYAAKKGMAPP